MASSNVDAGWLNVSLPARRPKLQGVANTQPINIAPLHDTLQKNAENLLNSHPKLPIFRVDYDHSSGSLSDVYESSYPTKLRQQFTCMTCRKFIQRFGDLALVDEQTGALLPLFWNPEHHTEPFVGPISAVAKLFNGRKVTKEFKVFHSKRHAGIKECGGWTHMSFDFPSRSVQAEAPKGFSAASAPGLAAMLIQVLHDYNIDVVRRASRLLLEDKLAHADNHKASMRWLLDLKESQSHKLEAANEVARHNLLFQVAVSSFLGCLKQLRSGAVGTLLSGIKESKSFQEIQASWNQIAGPLNYMRPTAAPTAGNISMAEQLFSSLGLTKEDMRREYLTPSQIPDNAYVFRDHEYTALKTRSSGIFGHITPKNASKEQHRQSTSTQRSRNDIPPTSVSFSTFVRKILPTAKNVQYQLSREPAHLYFFITGRPGTKPLMQWHDEKNRVSWYTHVLPVSVENHGLSPDWTPVSYIIPFPHLWDGIPTTTIFPLSEDAAAFRYYHSKNGFRYLVGFDGIYDPRDNELCLFPTLLKSGFHGVRSTIERYSKMGRVEMPDAGPIVGGIEINKSKSKDKKHLFRVIDQRGQQGTYEIVLFE